MNFELQNGILIPAVKSRGPDATPIIVPLNLCVLCQRPVEGSPEFNSDWTWPTCGHDKYPMHADCHTALNHTFPLESSVKVGEAREMAYSKVSCPICGCNGSYT